MKEDPAANLDRLHDIVVPPAVPWWPPAPGWYVLMALTAVLLLWLGWREWRTWKAEAFRREALREMESATDTAAVGSILRRTALAKYPRSTIAQFSGDAWVDWLEAHSPEGKMPPALRQQLTEGIYGPPPEESETASLRAWAIEWIEHFSGPVSDGSPQEIC